MKQKKKTYSVIKAKTKTAGYKIFVGSNIRRNVLLLQELDVAGKKVCIISDRTVFKLYGSDLTDALNKSGFRCTAPFVIAPGERSKTLRTLGRCCRHLAREALEREDMIVALGGGVPGDLAGFTAAVYLRGIRFVQVPTTLLAQVDASIGGKTGVDLPEGKNLVGAFHQPAGVLIDISTLKTLSLRHVRNGMAEIIKTAMLSGEKFLRWLEEKDLSSFRKDPAEFEPLILEACRFKAEIVSKDERDHGLRMSLNLGHTIGHAIECSLNYKILHGEAVSLGLVAALYISAGMAYASVDFQKRIEFLLKQYRLPVKAVFDPMKVEQALLADKKRISGKNRFVLPVEPGKVFILDDVPARLIRDALKAIRMSRSEDE